MKQSKVDNVLAIYWCIQIILLLNTTGFGLLTTAIAGCILISIIISYKTNFKSLIPIYLQFLVTIIYSFSLYIIVSMWGWKRIHIIVVITILVNFLICGFKGRQIKDSR